MAERFRVTWAPIAERDLTQVIEFIRDHDGVSPARSILRRIRERAETLRDNPSRCRYVPELKAIGVSDYRELIVGPYRVMFRQGEDSVVVLAVLDGRRDLEETLVRRALE